MQRTFLCPSCQLDLRVPEELIGQAVKCPACGSTFTAETGTIGAASPTEDLGVASDSILSVPETLDKPVKEPWEEDYYRPVRLGRSLREDALRRVQAPARALLSAGIVSCVACTVFIAVHVVMFWIITRQNSEFQGNVRIGGPWMWQGQELQYIMMAAGVLMEIVGIGLGIMIILGSRKMKRLEGYRRAMTCSILSMVTIFPVASPLSSCCLLGVPCGMWAVAAGIWSIVVLCKPEVKEAFS